MGFFAATGGAISVDHGASYFAAALPGMVSAVAGTIMRDIGAREVPMVMGPDDMYAATLLRLAAITFHGVCQPAPRTAHQPRPERRRSVRGRIPTAAVSHRHLQWHVQRIGAAHLVAHQRLNGVALPVGHLQQQFVVDLQQHP